MSYVVIDYCWYIMSPKGTLNETKRLIDVIFKVESFH